MYDQKYSLTSFNHGFLYCFVKRKVKRVASEKKLKVRLKLRNHKKDIWKEYVCWLYKSSDDDAASLTYKT